MRNRLNTQTRSPKRASVNNQQQKRLPRNIKVITLKEALAMLNKREDELAAGYHNLTFSQDIRDAPLLTMFKLPTMIPYEGKIDS